MVEGKEGAFEKFIAEHKGALEEALKSIEQWHNPVTIEEPETQEEAALKATDFKPKHRVAGVLPWFKAYCRWEEGSAEALEQALETALGKKDGRQVFDGLEMEYGRPFDSADEAHKFLQKEYKPAKDAATLEHKKKARKAQATLQRQKDGASDQEKQAFTEAILTVISEYIFKEVYEPRLQAIDTKTYAYAFSVTGKDDNVTIERSDAKQIDLQACEQEKKIVLQNIARLESELKKLEHRLGRSKQDVKQIEAAKQKLELPRECSNRLKEITRLAEGERAKLDSQVIEFNETLKQGILAALHKEYDRVAPAFDANGMKTVPYILNEFMRLKQKKTQQDGQAFDDEALDKEFEEGLSGAIASISTSFRLINYGYFAKKYQQQKKTHKRVQASRKKGWWSHKR